MAKLGLPVVYHAHDDHKLPHPKHEGETHGSVHHPDHHEFAAVVTRVRGRGRCDLTIFPPNRAPSHVDDVPQGTGSHSWRHVDRHDDRRDPAA